tara:strand:+ start:1435 stop:1986 length:552 start_codon:yes stop_codon:yes gene_type:complete
MLPDDPFQTQLLNWTVDIIENRCQLLALAFAQRSKFEGWLKFELASLAHQNGFQDVKFENAHANGRSDFSIRHNETVHHVELKTANTNLRMIGVRDMSKPITKNLSGIALDIQKLKAVGGYSVSVLFPIPEHDCRWIRYVESIESQSLQRIDIENSCRTISVRIGNYIAMAVVVVVGVPRQPL